MRLIRKNREFFRTNKGQNCTLTQLEIMIMAEPTLVSFNSAITQTFPVIRLILQARCFPPHLLCGKQED